MQLPVDLPSLLALIREHGDAAYTFMFAYAASHSLLFTMFAGYAAHAGALNVGTLIIVCWLGSFAGDLFRFWLGRRYGMRLVKSSTRLQRAVQTVIALTNRHHLWMIMIHRYPHGIRGIAGFAYGMSSLSWSTFMLINFAAAGIWACAVVALGYAFGTVSEKVMTQASSSVGLVMLVVFLALSWVLSKRLERVLEESR